MSSTAELLSESSESYVELGTETDSELETDTDHARNETDADSDLDELYATFDFEDDAQSQLSQAQSQTGENPMTHTHALPASLVSNSPLYSGAQLTALQSHLLIFQFALHHSLTKRAFTELLQLLLVHLPPGSKMPKSVHNLKQVFVDAFPESKAKEHIYCSFCQRLMPSGTQTCEGDGCSSGNPAVFITIPIGPQVKRMMEGIVLCFHRDGPGGLAFNCVHVL